MWSVKEGRPCAAVAAWLRHLRPKIPFLKFTGGLGGNVDVDEVRRVEVVQLVLKGIGPALVGVDLHEDVGLSDGGLFLDVPRVVVAECLGCVEPVQESDQ